VRLGKDCAVVETRHLALCSEELFGFLNAASVVVVLRFQDLQFGLCKDIRVG
jgi:hypothetical protein